MIDKLKKKLGEEAERLQHELSVTLPQEIRRAVEMGDLRENSEYKAALERQQFVQARLGQLRQRLSKLSSIDVSQIPSDKVGLGSHVVVKDETTGAKESYSMVFGDSVEFEEGNVSMSSPTGLSRGVNGLGATTILKPPPKPRNRNIIAQKQIRGGRPVHRCRKRAHVFGGCLVAVHDHVCAPLAWRMSADSTLLFCTAKPNAVRP